MHPSKEHPGNDNLATLKAVYDLFGAAGEVTVAQVMANLNLPRSTAGRHLAALAQAGRIIKKGAGRAARYTRNQDIK